MATAERPRLFPAGHRLPTIGLLLVITLSAFESMAVATVMPTTARALRGLPLYGLAFTSFVVATLVGVVDAGRRTDRRGPAGVLVAALLAFAAGLVVAGLAPTMPVFLLGRAISGYGAGASIVAIYVVVARLYDEELRPRVFAAMAAAWVLPALVGPALAGTVAERLSWRWVFGGLVPFVAVGAALLVPALRDLRDLRQLPAPGTEPPRRGGLGAALLLAAGVALVQVAATKVTPLRVAVAVGGLALLVVPLRLLLPSGTLPAKRGVPAAIALRGLLTAGFFGAEAFLPLMLVTVHGLRPSLAGLPLTLGAVGWSAGSWLQGRSDGRRRLRLLRAGFALVAGSVATLAAVALAAPAALAVLLWLVGGTGMGLAMPAISVLTLAGSPEHEQGANSAALQVSDAVASSVAIAVAGIVVAGARAAGAAPVGMAAADLLLGGVAAVGVLIARRAGG